MSIRRSSLLYSFVLLSILIGGGCRAPHSTTTSGFLTLENDRLYYEISGEGFPLILVSGGSGMDLRQWDRILPRLILDHRVVRYDPRGIGRSDNPTVRYSDSSDLERLLDHLDLDWVYVIGLSSSGGMVLEFVLQFPERVAGVVAAAPFVPGFEFSESMMARLAGFNQAAQEGREPFLDRLFAGPHFIPAPLDGSVRTQARENMTENYDKGAGFDPDLPILLQPPLIERLSEIESPVLLLVGELDHSEVLRRNRFLVERIPSAQERIVTQSGHNIPLENPDGFMEKVVPFLQGLAGH